MNTARLILIVLLLLVVAIALPGCGDSGPTFLLEPPDDPEAGPYGVALVDRDFRVRVDATVETLLYIPTDGPQSLADGPFPVALFVPGGGVEPHRYGWLSRHLARRGFLVVVPEHPFELAILATGNGADVVDAVDRAGDRSGSMLEGRVDDTPAMAAGHSLGGTVATKTWLRRPERFSHLLLLHSIPDEADAEVLARPRESDDRVFAVAGGRDGRIAPDEIGDELALFAGEVPLAIIEGQTHFQLVDGPAPSRLDTDGVATIETDESRTRLLETVDLFLEAYRRSDAPDFADPSHWPDGVVTPEQFFEAPQP